MLYIFFLSASISALGQANPLFKELTGILIEAKNQLSLNNQMVKTQTSIYKNNTEKPVQVTNHTSINAGIKIFTFNNNHDALYIGEELIIADKSSKTLIVHGKDKAKEIINPQTPILDTTSIKNDSIAREIVGDFIVFKLFSLDQKISASEFYFDKASKRIEKVIYFFERTHVDYVSHSILKYTYSKFEEKNFKWTKSDFIKIANSRKIPSAKYKDYNIIYSGSNKQN